MSLDLKRVVEGLLFVAEGPLSVAQLARVLEESDKDKIQTALDELTAEYSDLGRAFELVEVAGGYRLRTRSQLAPWLRRLKNQQTTRLSRAALESLAIIAYRQPVLKAEIERIRGVEVGGVLRMLMEKDLVKVVGRRDLPGRPLIYGTTKRFLEVFDLKDLKDLPTIEEMEALAGEGIALEGPMAEEGPDEAPLFREHPLPPEEDDQGQDFSGQEEWDQEPAPEPEDEPPGPAEPEPSETLEEDGPQGQDFSGQEEEDRDQIPPEAGDQQEPEPSPPSLEDESEPEEPADLAPDGEEESAPQPQELDEFIPEQGPAPEPQEAGEPGPEDQGPELAREETWQPPSDDQAGPAIQAKAQPEPTLAEDLEPAGEPEPASPQPGDEPKDQEPEPNKPGSE